MRKLMILMASVAAVVATTASAQIRLPVIIPLGRSSPAPPTAQGVPPGTPANVAQGALIAASGSDTVYFAGRSATIDPNATATLMAQARWLVANPTVSVRLEGHGGPQDTRDYALAIGDRRANEVRDFMVLQGVAPERISVISWGKERPGSVRVGASVVAVGARVVTVVQ
jgi:peptidoglycan-associated lipoprotein